MISVSVICESETKALVMENYGWLLHKITCLAVTLAFMALTIVSFICYQELISIFWMKNGD